MKVDTYSGCSVYDNKCACFEKLTQEECELISKNEFIAYYKKGESICKQGTFASHVMVIEKGLAKVMIEGQNNSLILKIIPEGSILGLTSISPNNVLFQYSAVAYLDSIVRIIDVNIFRKIVGQNSAFALEVINILSANSIQIYGRFFCMTHKQSYGRMADILLCFSERIFQKREFELLINRKEIAEISGMSTENVIRILKKFKEEGLIEITGKVFKILNYDKLKQISDLG